MFLLTQFIGLYVINHYSSVHIVDGQIKNLSATALPFDLETPQVQTQAEYYGFFFWLIVAFVFAILLLILFTKFEWKFILKLWFFFVVVIALSVSIYVLTSKTGIEIFYSDIPVIATLIALPLAFLKIYKQEFIVHNLTELLIYPGIATVFVPILNIYTMILLLFLISAYDMWAVWKSGIMQKMASYQINTLNLFSGFFIPYASKKTKEKIKLMREKYKNKKISKKELQSKGVKVNVAILGGGDIVFPIITAGVILKTFGFNSLNLFGAIWLIPLSSLFVILGATIGLGYLLLFSEKKKFYPAMPFITAGILLGMILSWIIF